MQSELRRVAEQQAVAATEVIRLQQENLDLNARLLALGTPGQAAGISSAAAAVAAAVAAQPKTIVDTKGIAKPKDFENDETKWPEFAFKYENWVGAVIPEARLYLRWAEMEANTIDDLSVLPDKLSAEGAENLQRQVYVGLCQLLSGESLDILRNGAEDNGLDAWRRLWRRWDPNTKGRDRAIYLSIVQPGQAKTVEQASRMMESWETKLRHYEQRRKKI